MDFPRRAPHQGSPRRSPMAMRPGGTKDADENQNPTPPVPAGSTSPLRKKVLGERNGGGGMEVGVTPPPPQPKPVPSPPTLTGRGAGAYDPKTNYTTPRPEFLRYDPERRREMLLRLAREAEFEEDSSSSAASGTEVAGFSVSSAAGSGSDVELDDGDENEEEEEVTNPGRGRWWARRLFLLLVAVACWCCYIYSVNPTAFPVHSDDSIALTRQIGGIYDVGVHELDSLRLSELGSLYLMGPEDELEETVSPIVQAGSEHVHQYNRRVSSGNQMAIARMGLADTCPSVQLGESTCTVGEEYTDNLDDLAEDSEPSEKNAAVISARNISCHWIGSTSTHTMQTIDMVGGSSGSMQQEEWENYSNQFVLPLVSTEKETGPANDKLDGRTGLKNEGLDLDTELWHYEQTAEAAKEICSKVKFLGSTMKPHLLQILACLSVASLVAAMFKYHPRSWAPAFQQKSAKSLVEVPVLVPHRIVQLPVPKQDESGSIEVPMQLPLSKSGLAVSSMDPVQLALPKANPSSSLTAPMVDHGNHIQKLQKGGAMEKVSYGNSQCHRDEDDGIFKAPVVELLGEFTIGDSSREKSIGNLNQHAGNISVKESSESLREDVDKMPKNSSILQTPSVGRARKEENGIKGEKDAISSPPRRSSRLRNKVTSP